jgi:histidine ammonia-lyase
MAGYRRRLTPPTTTPDDDEGLEQLMTVRITGRSLNRADLVRIARDGERVELDPAAADRMAATRAVLERALERGQAVYGASTAVGVLKRVTLGADNGDGYATWMLPQHLVGQGAAAPRAVVRATMARLANHLAEASPGVRPDLAVRLIELLNADAVPDVHSVGSIGQADLAPLSEIAMVVTAGFDLEPGEGTALIDNNAFATGWAAIALDDADALLHALEVAGALSLEGFAVNPSMLHSAIGDVRPYPGIRRSLTSLRDLLAGSDLWEQSPRNLQDPLSFRNLPQLLGAGRDALDHVDSVLAIELNASQGNPIVVPTEDRVVSIANFEILPLAAALDYLRIVLASILSAAAERVVKLLGTPWSGLPTGLVPVAGTPESGLTYLSLAAQSLAAEARWLAAPVSFEIVSTSHAEGVEDRTTMAPVAARRVAEQVSIGWSIAAVELAVAAQAAELREIRLGAGTARAASFVRRHVPYLAMGDRVASIGGLAEALARRELAVAAGSEAPR